MIKAVIFDLNGVFIKSRRLSDRITEDFGISSDEFMPALKSFLTEAYLSDKEDDSEYWAEFFKKWNIEFTRVQFYDYWFGSEKPDEEMISISKQLKKQGIMVFALSNNLKQRSLYYAEHFSDLMKTFDKVYYSWETGLIKPDVAAYRNVLSENDLKPQECLYFDDSEKNVEIANSLGIKSFIFDGVEGMKKELINVGLI